jgi:hypothetical protein
MGEHAKSVIFRFRKCPLAFWLEKAGSDETIQATYYSSQSFGTDEKA